MPSCRGGSCGPATCHSSKCSSRYVSDLFSVGMSSRDAALLRFHRSKLTYDDSLNAIILKELVRPERFELPTPCFVGKCSIQLSYGRTGYTAKFQPSSKSLCTAERNLSMQALIWPQMNSNMTQFATSLPRRDFLHSALILSLGGKPSSTTNGAVKRT